jgi:hypothetical protein
MSALVTGLLQNRACLSLRVFHGAASFARTETRVVLSLRAKREVSFEAERDFSQQKPPLEMTGRSF